MTTNEMVAPQPKQKMGNKFTPAINPYSRVAIVGSFIWHLAQMIIVMEAGMMVYMRLIRPLLAPTAFFVLINRYPLISYWLMVVSMVLPMIALMRVHHKSTWDYTLGMTMAMIAPVAALTLLVQSTLIPIQILFGFGDPVMFVTMAVYMVFHLVEFAGQHTCC